MKKLKNIIALSTFIFLLAFSAKVSFALDDEVVDSSTNDVTTQQVQSTDENVDSVNVQEDENAGIATQENDNNLNAVNAGFDLSLNGICLLEKGTYDNVGVAYETNDPNIQFRWLQYDVANQKWSVVSDWRTGNWITWTPPRAGDFWIYVEAKTSDGNVQTSVYGHHHEGASLQLNGICVLPSGTMTTMGVAYQTNDPNIQFQWKVYDLSTQKWSIVKPWSASNWGSFQPTHAGDYWLYVEALTSDGKMKTSVYGHRIFKSTITGFNVSPDSIGYPNSTTHLSASYYDSIGCITRTKFILYDGNTWSSIAENVNECDWTPVNTGSYLLGYQIINQSNNVIDQKISGYYVQNPYATINNVDVLESGNLTYNVSADVSTNDSGAQYRFLSYDLSSGRWGTIQDYSYSKSATWHAPHEGSYWVHTEVLLRDGSVKTFTKGFNATGTEYRKSVMLNVANNYASSTNYCLLVDRVTHKVGVFKGSSYNWSYLYYWDCSDGKPSTPTVSGTFKVQSRGYYFDSGNSRCFWYTQFHGNYLFHSVLYNKNGTLQDGRLGMGLSHGCVRLDINNAKWIYDNIPRNTTVVVYN